MERDNDYEEWLDEIVTLDLRCSLHPQERLSSPNGMFDAPCGLCEAEMAEEENSRDEPEMGSDARRRQERRERFASSWAVAMYEGEEWDCARCGCSPVSCDCPNYTPKEDE
jgi:hypothetical protein